MSDDKDVLENCENCRSTVHIEIHRLKQEIDVIKEGLEEVGLEVKELVEIFRASKGFIKVLGWLGKGLRWIAFTAAAIGAIWAITKTGK